VIVVGGALILILLAWIVSRIPRRLQPGEVVDEFGVYRSPSGDRKIAISKSPDGLTHVSFQHWNLAYPFRPSSEEPFTSFESRRDWFLCFDEFDRCWLFRGRWDAQWGKSWRSPTGAFWPHIQEVFVSGFFFDRSRPLYGTMIVSSTGQWEGVPQPFFDRIPAKHDAVWGQIPPIPDKPPRLSPSQLQNAQSFRKAK
jgi:hypothetical protein